MTAWVHERVVGFSSAPYSKRCVPCLQPFFCGSGVVRTTFQVSLLSGPAQKATLLWLLLAPVWVCKGSWASGSTHNLRRQVRISPSNYFPDLNTISVVLTSVWCELMAEPLLFRARFVRTRDLKIIAVGALFLGGFSGRLLLGRIDSAATLMIGGVLRVLIALSWLIVPFESSIVLL